MAPTGNALDFGAPLSPLAAMNSVGWLVIEAGQDPAKAIRSPVAAWAIGT
jgi:hypothetical protein